MIHGSWVTGTIADEGTLSGEIDLGREYDTVIIEIPTIDTAQITIRGAEYSGATYYDLYITDPADGGNNKLISASGTGGLTWIAPIGGYRYLKLFSSATQSTAAVTFSLQGVRS